MPKTRVSSIMPALIVMFFFLVPCIAVAQDDAGDAVIVRAQLRNLAVIYDTHIVSGSITWLA